MQPTGADSSAPASAPSPTRYRVLCGALVMGEHTARMGDVVALSEADVALALPHGVIEPIEE